MIIKDLSISPISQKFIKDLKTFNFIHSDRDSWIIKITTQEGYVGYGEASPIPNFNDETFEASGYALEGFKLALKGVHNIEIDEMMILTKAHTLEAPSANFAIETALYDILSQKKKLPLCKFLNSKALSKISVNGVYQLTDLNNYSVIKVKCGFRNLYDEIELLAELSEKYGDSVRFIIDLNQAYDLPKAIRFFKEMARFNIEYIEQPIKKNNFEDLLELRFHSDIPIALDESIDSVQSINNALSINCGDIFIIKPQSIGSFSEIKKAVQLVKSANKIPIITSSLEGIIGRLSAMHLSSSNLIMDNCGLLMEPIYKGEENIIPKINNGILDIPNNIGLGYCK
tara:strand:+ start:2253 stop:3278 length:1026 start_codon:yes stop_codon:yes gene_type:complete